MSYAAVVQHMRVHIECSEEDGKRDLHSRILDGEIEARAQRLEFKPALHYSPLPPSPEVIMNAEGPGWLRFVEPLKDYLTDKTPVHEWTDYHILFWADGQRKAAGRPTGRIIATGIELSRADVFRLYPAEEAGETVVGPPIDKSGASRRGRPLKYDWADAAAFITRYMLANDPSQVDALRALEEWFATKPGEAPDSRSVERFVSRVFNGG
ncbi:hypothetical protein [Rhizobium ruizarguesonis]|uniref:Uncharacterized protein n=1 Tax=Rhizobium ruizarguesonis TaxID=2081791 RepID=A0AAE8QA51_9HYPH|nr:hypothetical protein [Rhizobium ruizarguesonis]TBD78494.1 hypothetical protein ELH11_00510 [Rhizobium ruizarguesonis]TBE09651.1 hypothetical protein ELH09_00510 [Rhizobium ruizarguesonis]TBF16967.1 hypothetical protein ELG94_00510 [Rhizobium ruizarguesonis]